MMALSFVNKFCLTDYMFRIALQIGLTVTAFLITASVSLAAECADDPNECTPKKLCATATNVIANNTVWSTKSSNATHVEFAQSLGMSCGVVAIVDLCESDPNECKISQLCGKATKSNNGQTVWNSAAQGHVVVAKGYGLTCGISEAKALDFRKAFTAQSKLKRQQIQYALKKLGYYSYGIDGGWGKGTSSGIDKFVSTSNLQGKTEAQIFKTLLSGVSVPSSFEKKSTSTTVVTSNSNNNQNRNKRFDCDRTSLPTMGFKTRAAAESWYPAEIWLIMAADKSWMASWYGTKKERSQWDQKNNHLNIPQQDVIVKINGSALSDQKESTVWVNLIVTGNFQQLGGASYKCSKAKATSWEPD